MASHPKTYLTPEQYLEIERRAEFKSEYFQGEVFAMAGARYAHNVIAVNAVRELGQQLRSRPCVVMAGDMRVRVSETGLYAYPDILTVCNEPQFADDHRDTLLNPNLIVEVLSESTENYDRGHKFELYRSLESLQEYLMISSQRISAELFTRQPDGRWMLTASSRLGDSLDLQSVGCRLALADLYEKVDFSPPEPVIRPLAS